VETSGRPGKDPKLTCAQTGGEGTRTQQAEKALAVGEGHNRVLGGDPAGQTPVAPTSGGLEPLLLHAVADLSLGVTFGQVAGDHSCVPFVHLDHMLAVELEIFEICRESERQGTSVAGSASRCQLTLSLWTRACFVAVPAEDHSVPSS